MDGFGDLDCINSMITDLLSDCGEDCDYHSDVTCTDEIACNTGDSADCIYPIGYDENNPDVIYYDCCGECLTDHR